MNKYDAIPTLNLTFALLYIFGQIDKIEAVNQLMAQFSLYAIGVVSITLANEGNAFYIRITTLFISSLIFIFDNNISDINQNSQLIMVVLLCIQTIIIIRSTQWFLMKFRSGENLNSNLFQYVLYSNIILSYLYSRHSEFIDITKWWPFSGLYLIFFTKPNQIESIVATLIICILLTLIILNKKTEGVKK